MNLSVFPLVIQCSVFNEKSIRIPENTVDLKLAWIVSREYGENHGQAGSAAVISSNDKHTSTRGAATHILHSYLDPDSSLLTRFPTPNTNVSEQATTWCFIVSLCLQVSIVQYYLKSKDITHTFSFFSLGNFLPYS